MSRRWLAGLAALAAMLLMTVPCLGAPAETNNGAEEIMIDAGEKPSVYFPHRQHQETAAIDCQTCHELFPKEPGSIRRLISEGTLKSKQIMKDLCISCHTKTEKAGKPSGPRSCSVCHAK